MLEGSTDRFKCAAASLRASKCEDAFLDARLRQQPPICDPDQSLLVCTLQVWRCTMADASALCAMPLVQCPPVPPYSPLVRALDVWRCGRPSSRAAGDSSRPPSSSAVSLEVRLLAGKAVSRLPARAGALLSRRGGERCCTGLGEVPADVAMSSSVWWKMSCRVACRQCRGHIERDTLIECSHTLLLG